ncbi:MAG TPA: PspC domain-containing protein [Flavobacteriales bacterium]|nr:PspC domain-containing protein [Flavobacteriales bacterium]
MKKTLTANISGTVFHIEEDAYDMLQRYLGSIRAQFGGTAGRDEIMADIEARIAELFNERLDGKRQVVSLTDVEHVMSVMGQPEDFADGDAGDDAPPAGPEQAGPQQRKYKRFFRDPDDKWVGGVLGGLAAYIGMDPVWVRVAMLILVWPTGGVLVAMYILLWILVPKAESAADLLQMRGEAVTVENIKRIFEESGERLKKGSEQMASEARDLGKEWGPKGRAWSHEAGQTARRTGRDMGNVIVKVIGILFIITGIGFLMSLITGAIGLSAAAWSGGWSAGNVGALDLGGLLFQSRDHAVYLTLACFLVLAIPVIGLIIAGIRLLMDTRTPRWLGWTLSFTWLASLIAAIVIGAGLANDFRQRARNRTEIPIMQPAGTTLLLDVIGTPGTYSYNWTFDDGDFDWEDEGFMLEDGRVRAPWVEVDVQRSPDTLFHVIAIRTARGANTKEAALRAEHITYPFQQHGDSLMLSNDFTFPSDDKFRAQDVDFTIQVPVGRSIHFTPGARMIIYDVDNVTNTLDSEMIDRTWTMTERGLQDMNAPAPRSEEQHDNIPAPPDTVKAPSPIAAVVWQKPAKRRTPPRAVRPNTANVARTDMHASTTTVEARPHMMIPNLLDLVIRQVH